MSVLPPPYFITADDKRGLIVVTVAIVLAFVWTCFLIRLWLRFTARDWKSDDWVLAIATLFHSIQSGFILHQVGLGLGTSQSGVPLSQLEQLGKEGFATQIFYICILCLSKCSVLALYLRLSPDGAHKLTTYAAFAASVLWAILSIILISVPCNLYQYYADGPEQCHNRWPKWQAIGALDIVTEVIIFSIALRLVWTLHMRFKAKVIVTLAFSARLPVIIVAAVRLHYLHQRISGQSDTFEYIVATQWQMGYAIMSSTITGMGPLLRPFEKEYTASYKDSAYGRTDRRSHMPGGTQDETVREQLPRNSWQSEGYLMQPIPSRRESKTTIPDSIMPSTTHVSKDSTSSVESVRNITSSPVPNLLTADANFRPADGILRHDTEVWADDRTRGFNKDHGVGHTRNSRGLVISKRTQFSVEIDDSPGPSSPV